MHDEMINDILIPSGSYTRNINGTEKTFLIFQYNMHGVQYNNYSTELPQGVKPNEVFALQNGNIDLELILNKDTPF